MGIIFGKKQPQLQYSDAPNIMETTEQVKRALDKIRIEKDETVIISKPVMETLSMEFQNLINTFQKKEDGAYIDKAVIESLQKISHHASTLKYKDEVAESNQNGENPELKHDTIKQAESKEMAIDQNEMAKGQPLNIPVKYQQLATALEVVKQLPETLSVLRNWIRSINVTEGASRILTRQIMDLINEELVFDTVTVSGDNSIELSQGSADTILQRSQEYINFIEEKSSKSQQVTGKLTSDVFNTNQTLGPPHEPLKKTLSDPTQPFTYIKVLNPISSGATHGFITALQGELEQKGIKLNTTDVQSFNDDETGSKLVMVICSNHSRLHADVASAFKDIHRNRFHRILLAILHCKKERLLPSWSSKAELKDDVEFGVIPEVVDFAFDKEDTRGVYECEFNKKAFEMISNLIESGSLGNKPTETSRSSCKKQKTKEMK